MTNRLPADLVAFQSETGNHLLHETLVAHERFIQARSQRYLLVHLLAVLSLPLWVFVRWSGHLPEGAVSLILSCWAGLFLALALITAREWLCYRERARFLDVSRGPTGARH